MLFTAIFFGFLIGDIRLHAWPESHLHPHFPFKGKVLSDSFKTDRKDVQFALYNGKGVWDTGREHLKMFLKEHEYSYTVIQAKDVLAGVLESSRVSVLIMPGGESWEYLKELGEAGAQKIRSFVEKGGGYIGICAGAFYAVSDREGGHATGHYGIGLLEGTAYDGTALQTDPFIDGMMDFDMVPNLLLRGLRDQYRIVLFGGPSFKYTEEEAQKKQLSVLARFQKISHPAMVLFQYGEGQVYLSAPHLEIEEDRTDWGKTYLDPDSEWPILKRVGQSLLALQKPKDSIHVLR